jgi:hypothetical protein
MGEKLHVLNFTNINNKWSCNDDEYWGYGEISKSEFVKYCINRILI